MTKRVPTDPFGPLREAAVELPSCPASTDPETPAAVRAFDAELGAGLPSELMMRLIRENEMPTPLIAELLDRKPQATREAAQRAMDRFMALWNHTPRAELDDATPHQVATRRH